MSASTSEYVGGGSGSGAGGTSATAAATTSGTTTAADAPSGSGPRKEIYTYQAPWTVFSMAWSRKYV